MSTTESAVVWIWSVSVSSITVTVADRGAPSQEAHLADDLVRAEFGEEERRLAEPGALDAHQAVGDHVEGLARIALAHEHGARAEGAGFTYGHGQGACQTGKPWVHFAGLPISHHSGV